ncbi:MAG: cation diffusion facilitator family transporter [Lachnospiraceae bacterium]|nr:cation diffusion facilitator family transporter [Lachnospiraceae bacterium]
MAENNQTGRVGDGRGSPVAGHVKYIKLAAATALAGNAALALMKLVAGYMSGSAALVGDAMDSGADVFISLVTLALVRVMDMPADRGHPWGHGRSETLAEAALSFVLFYAGGRLALGSAMNLARGATPEAPQMFALAVACISIAGKLALAYSQFALAKRSGSGLIRANAKNMAGDVMISSGVVVGLLISAYTGNGTADGVISIFVGAWVVKTAVGIFLDANRELMDGGGGAAQYRLLFDAIKGVEGAGNPHRARIRKIGGFLDIDVDIEVDPAMTVEEAHQVATAVERAVQDALENVFDIMVHVEPAGIGAHGEAYGLSEKDL